MPELAVRTSLPYLDEPQADEDRDDDTRSERRDAPHRLGDFQRLGAHECGLERRLTVLAEHLDDLEQVRAKLVKRRTLRVCAGPTWNVSDEEAGVLVSLNYGGIGLHPELV